MKIIRTSATISSIIFLTGCGTFNLGYVQPQAGKSPDNQNLDTLICKDQARLAAEAPDRQVGDFLLGFTIIGVPIAYELGKSKQREVFKECMTAKGYQIKPATDDKTGK